MNTTSPKRRAALATLDANAKTTTSTPTSIKQTTSANADLSSAPLKPFSVSNTTTTSNSRRSSGLLASAPVLAPPVAATLPTSNLPSVGMKRSGMVLQDPVTDGNRSSRKKQEVEDEDEEETPAAKKSKLDNDDEAMLQTEAEAEAEAPASSAERSRTHSPDASSLFDASGAEDATWVTTATEPDVLVHQMPAVATVVPRPPALTREQAREKVEILRLRLGLASYKLRTGQISIPLADLQARPLPAAAAATAAAPPTIENTPESSQEGNVEEQGEDEDVVAATPPAAAVAAAAAAAISASS